MADQAEALIRLAQYLSPAFPVGGYAYSHGLEHAISLGEIPTAAAFSDWLGDILRFGAGWNDAVLMACTLRGEDPQLLADYAQALSAGRERWRETCDQGRAFLRAANALVPDGPADLPLPVAVAQKARPLGLPIPVVLSQYLHAFAGNLTTIATRAVPLGQTEAQTALAGLLPSIAELAARAASAGLDDLAGAALRSDLHSLGHETQDVRLYLT